MEKYIFLILGAIFLLSDLFSQSIRPNQVDLPSILNLQDHGQYQDPFLDNTYLIKFKDQSISQVLLDGSSRGSSIVRVASKTLESTIRKHSLVHYRSMESEKVLVSSLESLRGLGSITFNSKLTSEELKLLDEDPFIEYIEPYPVYFTHGAPTANLEFPTLNDSLFLQSRQYSIHLIESLRAFSALTGDQKIKIAIVDDAVFIDHEDLLANVDRVNSFDVADDNDNPNPPFTGSNAADPNTFSHGTHCAGIAAAVNNNNIGIASIGNNQLEIIAIKATRDSAPNTRVIERSFDGVARAIQNGARVISMSFGGPSFSRAFQELINEAASDGVVFIASAGNGNTDVRSYPAAYNNVMAVANTNAQDIKAGSSHFGSWVDISAPGTAILSTVASLGGGKGTYTEYSGTSMSGPMVAGLAGLILTQKPYLTPSEVFEIIQSTADNIDGKNTGFERILGAGRINAFNAILKANGLEGIPKARISSSRTDIFKNQAVQFYSNSLGKNLSYEWQFSEGSQPSTSTEKSPQVNFSEASDATFAILTVSNSEGSSSDTLFFSVDRADDCGLLSFPNSGERVVFTYLDPQNGAISGHNSLNHSGYANRYFFSSDKVITGAVFAFQQVTSADPENQFVTFRLYDASGTGRSPGRVIAERVVAYSEIIPTGNAAFDRNSYFEIIWDEPIQVPSDGYFHLGFEFSYGSQNRVTAFTKRMGGADGRTTFLRSGRSWISFNAFSNTNVDLDISPIVMDSDFLPLGEIIASTEELCLTGDAIVSFSLENLENISAEFIQWEFKGAAIQTSNEINPEVEFIETGRHEVRLTVTPENCTESLVTIKKIINVADCEKEPIAKLFSNKLAVAKGEEIQFTDASLNTTSREWEFQGGMPEASKLPFPIVRYDSVGIYTVRINAQNPLGDESSLVEDDLITVYESGECNFLFFPLSGNPSEGIESGAGGSLSGHNNNRIEAYANWFTLEAGQATSGGRLQVSRVNFNQNDPARISVKLWKGKIPSGPEEILLERSISFIELRNAIRNNDGFLDVYFEEHIGGELLNNDEVLFFGIEIFYDNLGQMSLFSNSQGDSEDFGTRTYLRLSNGEWGSYSDVSSGGFVFDAALFPAVIQSSPSVIPEFTVNGELLNQGDSIVARIGERIELEALNEDGLIYEWSITDGVLDNAVRTRTSVVFDQLGTKFITLTTRDNCEAVAKSRTIVVTMFGQQLRANLLLLDEKNNVITDIQNLLVNSTLKLDASGSREFTSLRWIGPDWFLEQLVEDALIQEVVLKEVGFYEIGIEVSHLDIRAARRVQTLRVNFPLNTIDQSNSLRLYPNPTSHNLTLALSQMVAGAEIKIFNLSGVLVEQLSLDNSRSINIDVSSYSDGIYILKFKSSGIQESLRFIKY
ncbi:MAG: S8 family serine peptidase [Cyclobacteriaceae bacterium]|nr:S8 family serine peptidase [Cyclobacteriaceae bacterium]